MTCARPISPTNRQKSPSASHTKKTLSARLGGGVVILLLLLIGAVLFGLIFGVLETMFRVEHVVIEGVEPNETILAAANLSDEDRLYAIDTDAVRSAILRSNPYLSDVRIERRLPNTVALVCTPRSAAYYLEIEDEWFALSADLVVLECGASAEGYAARGLVRLILPKISSAIAGKQIVFDEQFDSAYLLELLQTHSVNPLYVRTDLLRVDSRFDVRMIVDGQYALTLGDSSDMELKLILAEKILADSMFDGNTGAFLDISHPAESSVILDKVTDYSMLWRE